MKKQFKEIYILPWFNDKKDILCSTSQIPRNPVERAVYFPKMTTQENPFLEHIQVSD